MLQQIAVEGDRRGWRRHVLPGAFDLGHSGLSLAVLLILAQFGILLGDLLTPPSVSPAALSIVLVAVATWSLSTRLAAVVVLVSLAFRVLADLSGQFAGPTFMSLVGAMLLMAVPGRGAAVLARSGGGSGLRDRLTGLPNRTYFRELLSAAVINARYEGDRLGLVVVDITSLGGLNAKFGREGGDEVLTLTAERLGGVLGPTDILGRIGEDEFAILVRGNPDREESTQVAALIGQAFDRPLEAALQPIRVRLSVGLATFPHNSSDADGLLRRAVDAMHVARHSRGAYWEVPAPDWWNQ